MHPGRSNVTTVSPNENWNRLGRFNVTIVSPNSFLSFFWEVIYKFHRRQTYWAIHQTRSNVTIVNPNASQTLRRYYSNAKCSSDASRTIAFWFYLTKCYIKYVYLAKRSLRSIFNYCREALRGTLKYFYLTKCYMKYFHLAKRYINLNFYINCREALRGTLRYGSGGQIASEKEPNRLPVFRDQKVLSEVRNGPLLQGEYFSQPFELRNSSLIQ